MATEATPIPSTPVVSALALANETTAANTARVAGVSWIFVVRFKPIVTRSYPQKTQTETIAYQVLLTFVSEVQCRITFSKTDWHETSQIILIAYSYIFYIWLYINIRMYQYIYIHIHIQWYATFEIPSIWPPMLLCHGRAILASTPAQKTTIETKHPYLSLDTYEMGIYIIYIYILYILYIYILYIYIIFLFTSTGHLSNASNVNISIAMMNQKHLSPLWNLTTFECPLTQEAPRR